MNPGIQHIRSQRESETANLELSQSETPRASESRSRCPVCEAPTWSILEHPSPDFRLVWVSIVSSATLPEVAPNSKLVPATATGRLHSCQAPHEHIQNTRCAHSAQGIVHCSIACAKPRGEARLRPASPPSERSSSSGALLHGTFAQVLAASPRCKFSATDVQERFESERAARELQRSLTICKKFFESAFSVPQGCRIEACCPRP